MDILEKLYKNSGLLHVAEHVVQFMDSKTMAKCRLVNKELHDLVDKCFRKRAVQELQRLCEKTFQVSDNNNMDFEQDPAEEPLETCVFNLWPEWKNVVHEIKLEDYKPVILLLENFCDWNYQSSKPSPLFLADELADEDETFMAKALEILASTSLDFTLRDEENNTVLHKACELGTKEVVETLLNNAVKKGINANAVNEANYTIVVCAILNNIYAYHTSKTNGKEIIRHLFERRNEFNFDIYHVNQGDLDGSILHFASKTCIETFEIILEWAIEKGIDVSDVNSEGDTILHYTCKHNSEAALVLLESCDKFGFDRSVMASMANATNQMNKRPFDLARQRFMKRITLSVNRAQRIGRKVIEELKKYN